MKRVIIVHRWDGNSGNDWRAWLKSELERKGFEVIAPDMPDTFAPAIDKWVAALAKAVGTPDKNTYFVGHSIGCQTILRYLERTSTPVGGAVFVAGWFNLENLESDEVRSIARSWIEGKIDAAKVRTALSSSTLIISDNDPYGCFDENKRKFAEIGSKIVVIPDGGHFTEDEGCKELPAIIEELEKL
ncbi:MAG TPA: alpha/beta fold hydrolase [Candidatus Paceibacterota bacterium]